MNICTKLFAVYNVWLVARVHGANNDVQRVSAFVDFVSATAYKPGRTSTNEHHNPIHQPFTEYSVIQELLKRSEEAKDEVGQYYVLSTFDLGGCMKALLLMWSSPDRYKRHIIMTGPFHTIHELPWSFDRTEMCWIWVC